MIDSNGIRKFESIVPQKHMNYLELRRIQGKSDPSSNWHPPGFVDFFINGTSLLTALGGGYGTLISPLGWGEDKAYEKEILKQFRCEKKSDLPGGRIMLYVCPACGDIGCGAITMLIRDYGTTIEWSAFASDNGYEDIDPIDHPTLTFNRQQYFKAFQAIR